MATFQGEWLEACADISSGSITGPLMRFLQTPGLPLYYKMKANLALSGSDIQDDPWENLVACRHYLNEAEAALAECRNVYTDAEEVKLLNGQEAVLKGEWDDLKKREALDEGW